MEEDLQYAQAVMQEPSVIKAIILYGPQVK